MSTQAYAIAIPCLLILVGMFFNWSEAKSLRAEVRELRTDIKNGFSEVNKRVDGVMNHLVTFYNITGKLEGRVDELSKKP